MTGYDNILLWLYFNNNVEVLNPNNDNGGKRRFATFWLHGNTVVNKNVGAVLVMR
jgi:hypothetical protein